ncbi:MAG: hypothetical protein V4508_22675 [Pseudomonadota bacterium]
MKVVAGIGLSCLVAGSTDIGSAVLITLGKHNEVGGMFRAIASGVLGAAAFKGGTEAAMLGFGLHYAIMFGIAACYWALLRNVALARELPIVAGAAFGLGVYGVMNLVVLPLSNIAFTPKYPPLTLMRDIAIHMGLVGIPIALVMRAALTPRLANNS